MEVMHPCRCCMRCPLHRGLTTPYPHLGKIEVYSDMLEECFNLHIVLDSNENGGICEDCVGLRDASDFKLQVQNSQEWLQRALLVKGSTANSNQPGHSTPPSPGLSTLHRPQDTPGAYTCDACAKHFTDKFDLIQHLQTHTQTRRFTRL